MRLSALIEKTIPPVEVLIVQSKALNFGNRNTQVKSRFYVLGIYNLPKSGKGCDQ